MDSSLPFALTNCPAFVLCHSDTVRAMQQTAAANKAATVTCVAPHTARMTHLASPVINKKEMEGNYIPPMLGLKRGDN